MNKSIALKRFNEGLIVDSLLGGGDFFIPDNTFKDRHDDLLVMLWLTEWADNEQKKYKISFAIDKILCDFVEKNDIERYLDFSLACVISLSDGNINFINQENLIASILKNIKKYSEQIESDSRLRKIVNMIYTYIEKMK